MIKSKYGIDFGTTNSSIAIVGANKQNPDEVKVFDVDNYDMPYSILRSVVAYKNGKTYVGNEGLEVVNGNDDNPVRKVKLRIINEESDSAVFDDIKLTDVMSQILERLKKQADKQLGKMKPDGVVIGVPYQTSVKVKNLYYKSLLKAGFYKTLAETQEKTEFVEEPVAVALFYGKQIIHQNKYALVFDFGGGTLDVAVVKLNPDGTQHSVIGKCGHEGAGEELTRLLFQNAFFPAYSKQYCNGSAYAVSKLFKSMGCRSNNVKGIWNDLEKSGLGWKFINQLDNAKIELSVQDETTFAFYEQGNAEHSEIEFKPIKLTRAMFEKAIGSELDQIRGEMTEMFKTIDVKKSAIDEVLMAGGSSMIPAVQKMLTEYFGPKVHFDNTMESGYFINVMTCIAQGLAIAGYKKPDDVLIDDVTSFDYGVYDYTENRVNVIIPKGTPVSKTDYSNFTPRDLPPETEFCFHVYETKPNDQGFFVDIYEGDNKWQLIFDKRYHSGDYTIYFKIDAKRGVLEIHVYDNKLRKWVDDLPIGDRSFKISKR